MTSSLAHGSQQQQQLPDQQEERTSPPRVYQDGEDEDDDDDDEDEVENEEYFMESDEEIRYFKEPNVLRQILRSNQCWVLIYVLLTLSVLASLVALIVISVQIVGPFQKVQGFRSGTCIPVSTVTLDRKSCLCGITCHAKYRCIAIRVTYHTGDGRDEGSQAKTMARNGTLYEDEATLDTMECSYFPECKSTDVQIESSVHGYESRYGVIGLPFNCLYGRGHVIRKRRYELYHVVNGILWPVMILLVASGVLLAVYRGRNRR